MTATTTMRRRAEHCRVVIARAVKPTLHEWSQGFDGQAEFRLVRYEAGVASP